MGTQYIPVGNQHIKQCNERELFEYALSQTHQHGFEYFLFQMTPKNRSIHSSTKTITNYPNELIQYYNPNAFSHQNPLITHCYSSIDSIIWDESLLSGNPKLWEEMKKQGLNVGWSQSLHDIRGMTSMLSLARPHPPITSAEVDEKAASVLWLCSRLHKAVCSIIYPTPKTQAHIEHLSLRETEVLTWTAQGKTASDVGMILGLTTRTVNFHISSAVRKLGTSNKTSAVVLASIRGII